MLEDLRIKVLGHKVRQTFIVMDFSKHPMSFEMILGRPFMREAKMVHDWSKNIADGEEIPHIAPVNMLGVAHVTSDDKKEAHLPKSETDDSSKASGQYTSKTESQGEMDSEP
ncbi:hypothetical protein DD606_26175, partial [Enterobacter cloacae complex sp. GF14B]